MLIRTKHFGEREVEDAAILQFEEGLFGFEDLRDYVILADDDTSKSAFCWLQSIEEPTIALPLVDPMVYFKDYNPEIAANYIERIGDVVEEDLNLFSVVVVPEDITKMTVNLKAPIVVNVKTKKGIQVIAEDEEYKLKTNLYEQIQKLKGAGE